MQIPLLNGIYSGTSAPEFRTSYPRNLVPVPKSQGVSTGYLRPSDGIEQTGTGPGPCRGGINWRGVMYRVLGGSLCRVAADGAVTVIGGVGGSGAVTMDYSFDRLAIAAGGQLWYYDGSTLTQVNDTDLLTVLDMRWIAGYFLCTDGTSLVTTDLNDPTSVQVLNYGSAESDPDLIMAVDELANEAYAIGRYTIEVFQNVGGTGFPFARIESAQVGRGVIGTHAYCNTGETFVFMGSARGEAPGVYLMQPGASVKVSTGEIDAILLGYTEAQLAQTVCESRADKDLLHILFHLPDQCLVYDVRSSQVMGVPIWFTLDSGGVAPSTYRARHLVWCYDRWNVGDPIGPKIGRLVTSVSSHYGDVIGWAFGTPMLYIDGNAGIVHELELVCLTGRVSAGIDPTLWASYSEDGVTWSQERETKAGRQGERMKRICWRNQGQIRNLRMQRFRGTSDSFLSIARLEAQIEPLFVKGSARG